MVPICGKIVNIQKKSDLQSNNEIFQSKTPKIGTKTNASVKLWLICHFIFTREIGNELFGFSDNLKKIPWNHNVIIVMKIKYMRKLHDFFS